MGRFSVEELTWRFAAQFRDQPAVWKNFIAAVLFSSGVRYDHDGRLCFPWHGAPTYPVRWVSKRLKAKLIESWKIFHDKLPEDWRDCDRLWECAGYQAVGAGIGLSDFQYEHRIEDAAEMAQIEDAFNASNFEWLEGITCFNGVVD